jgi:hypothetical protein
MSCVGHTVQVLHPGLTGYNLQAASSCGVLMIDLQCSSVPWAMQFSAMDVVSALQLCMGDCRDHACPSDVVCHHYIEACAQA